MVAPALLAAIETVKGLGPAAQGSFFTFKYVGTSRWWKKHCPEGMIVTVPAWIILVLFMVGGMAAVMMFWGEIVKFLDALGMTGKKNGKSALSGGSPETWEMFFGPGGVAIIEAGKEVGWW